MNVKSHLIWESLNEGIRKEVQSEICKIITEEIENAWIDQDSTNAHEPTGDCVSSSVEAIIVGS